MRFEVYEILVRSENEIFFNAIYDSLHDLRQDGFNSQVLTWKIMNRSRRLPRNDVGLSSKGTFSNLTPR